MQCLATLDLTSTDARAAFLTVQPVGDMEHSAVVIVAESHAGLGSSDDVALGTSDLVVRGTLGSAIE